jgi:hypothetical protein
MLTLPGLQLRPSLVQPVASLYTDCAIAAPLPLGRFLNNYITTIITYEWRKGRHHGVFKELERKEKLRKNLAR